MKFVTPGWLWDGTSGLKGGGVGKQNVSGSTDGYIQVKPYLQISGGRWLDGLTGSGLEASTVGFFLQRASMETGVTGKDREIKQTWNHCN